MPKTKTSTKTNHKLLLSLVLVAVFFTSLVLGFFFDFKINIAPKKLSLNPNASKENIENSVDINSLSQVVTPDQGYLIKVNWGDTGKKLISSGAIDLNKYQQNYADPQYKSLLEFLTQTQNQGIAINSDTAYFWVNTLWALGLVQKSDVLDKGIMGTEYREELGSFASTGGWTLGTKDATSLYSSAEIIPLTEKQQKQVTEIASNIYRPCCGNSTAFPDCNHGMAMLGLIELMVSQGATDQEVYQAALAFNSYWFPQTYIDLAFYFQEKESTSWNKVDPKRILSQEFSSASGYKQIKRQIQDAPNAPKQGGSCGA